jgi:membrane protein YdbS with pleckstrin-like domain
MRSPDLLYVAAVASTLLRFNPLDPHVDRYIAISTGERKVVEIRKHWISSVWPLLRLLFAEVVFWFATTFSSGRWLDEFLFWLLYIAAMVLLLQATHKLLAEYRDRFVITTRRVLRVHGVLSSNRGMIPLHRITDITTHKTLFGRLLNYGHFTFESAGLVQALRTIRYVKDIDLREEMLRMVIAGDMPDLIASIEEGDDGT